MGTNVPAASTSASAGPLSWWAQRKARAIQALNYGGNVQVDYPINFDYSIIIPVITGTTPVDTTAPGVVYKMTGNPSNLNDMPGSGGMFIAAPKASSWYVARKCMFAGASLASNYCVVLGLDNGSSYIEIEMTNSVSSTQINMIMAAGSTASAAVLIGTLGTANVPIGIPITFALYHDMIAGALVVEINDVEITRILASGGGLDKMPTTQLTLDSQCKDTTVAFSDYGGFAMLSTPQ